MKRSSPQKRPPLDAALGRAIHTLSARVAWTTVALGLMATQSSHGSPLISIGFEESEGYSSGRAIEMMRGWSSSEEGGGMITREDRLFGEQSLKIEANEEAVGIGYWTEGVPQQGVRFIEVSIKPVPIEMDDATAILNLWGSEIGFTRGDDNTIHLRLPSGGNEGVASGDFSIPARASAESEAGLWLNVVIRQDLGAATWDLFLDGNLVAIDLRLGEVTEAFGIEVGAHEAMYLDGLGIGTENPLLPDSDGDGMPDAYEVAHNLNPSVNDRNGDWDGDGISNIAEYLAGTSPSVPGNGAVGQIIYVDNVIGSDSNSGQTSNTQGSDGPKFSIKAAMSAAQSGTTIVVMPGTGIYSEGSRSAKGKRITIRTVRPIIIK